MAKNYTMARYDGRVVACRIGSSKTRRSMPIFAISRRCDRLGVSFFSAPVRAVAWRLLAAARHPERVSNLVLYGAFARGRLMRDPSARDLEEAEMMLKLVELGWGRENHVSSSLYNDVHPRKYAGAIPLVHRPPADVDLAGECRGLIRGFDAMDVTDLLPKVSCPTVLANETTPAYLSRKVA